MHLHDEREKVELNQFACHLFPFNALVTTQYKSYECVFSLRYKILTLYQYLIKYLKVNSNHDQPVNHDL